MPRYRPSDTKRDLAKIDWSTVFDSLSVGDPRHPEDLGAPQMTAQRIKQNPTWTPETRSRLIEAAADHIETHYWTIPCFQLLSALDLDLSEVQGILTVIADDLIKLGIAALTFSHYRTSALARDHIARILTAQGVENKEHGLIWNSEWLLHLFNHYKTFDPENLSNFLTDFARALENNSAQNYPTFAFQVCRWSYPENFALPPISLFALTPLFVTALLTTLATRHSISPPSMWPKLFRWDLSPEKSRECLTPILRTNTVSLELLDRTLASLQAPSWKTFYENMPSAELAHLLSTAHPTHRSALLGLVKPNLPIR